MARYRLITIKLDMAAERRKAECIAWNRRLRGEYCGNEGPSTANDDPSADTSTAALDPHRHHPWRTIRVTLE